MALMFPLKLACSLLVGAGDNVLGTPLCCHLSSELTPGPHEGAVGGSSPSGAHSQFYFPLDLAPGGSSKALRRLLLHGIIVFS